MERRVWRRPLTEVQKFEANEYVAACGDKNKVYKFKCDAPTEWGIGLVYEETNGKEGLQVGIGGDTFRSTYHPCGETHEAPVTDEFIKGYYIHDIDSFFNPTSIIIWTGMNDDNTHCTRNLNMDSWETAKS